MLPAPPKKTSWCIPEVLFDQLDRLAGHPYSAQWASHVSNQLHSLTERDRLEGDDVQSILADLGDAAQEAVRMADESPDHRLRVELLRAHWRSHGDSIAGRRCTSNVWPHTFKAELPPAVR